MWCNWDLCSNNMLKKSSIGIMGGDRGRLGGEPPPNIVGGHIINPRPKYSEILAYFEEIKKTVKTTYFPTKTILIL